MQIAPCGAPAPPFTPSNIPEFTPGPAKATRPTAPPLAYPNITPDNSTPDAIRTRDPRIRNPVLYPSELRGHTPEINHLRRSRPRGRVSTTILYYLPARSGLADHAWEVSHRICPHTMEPVRVHLQGTAGDQCPSNAAISVTGCPFRMSADANERPKLCGLSASRDPHRFAHSPGSCDNAHPRLSSIAGIAAWCSALFRFYLFITWLCCDVGLKA